MKELTDDEIDKRAGRIVAVARDPDKATAARMKATLDMQLGKLSSNDIEKVTSKIQAVYKINMTEAAAEKLHENLMQYFISAKAREYDTAKKQDTKTSNKSAGGANEVEKELNEYLKEIQVSIPKDTTQMKKDLKAAEEWIEKQQKQEEGRKIVQDYTARRNAAKAEKQQKEQKRQEAKDIVKAYTERRKAAAEKNSSGTKEETETGKRKRSGSPTQIPKMGRG